MEIDSSPGSSPPNSAELELNQPNTVSTSTAKPPQPLGGPIHFNYIPSSDPIQGENFSATSHRLNSRKRPRSILSRNFEPQNSGSAKETLLKARDLILEASLLAETSQEQSKILDLLGIFREYTEIGEIKALLSLLASQVNNLESATRKIESKTRALK